MDSEQDQLQLARSALLEYWLTKLCFVSVGVVLSALAVAASIATWCVFRKSRNYQNYISVNQCIVAALHCMLACAECAIGYNYVNYLFTAVIVFDVKYLESIEDLLTSLARYLNHVIKFRLYTFVSLCFWNTAAAVLCYSRVVQVYHRDVYRKYLITNVLCYGVPALYFITLYFDRIQSGDLIFYITVTVTCAAVLVHLCIYSCVTVALCKGKRPEAGETVRTVTTAIVIFIIFGLFFTITFVLITFSLLLFVNQFVESEQWMIILMQGTFALIVIDSVLTSMMALVFSAFHVIGRKENRRLWQKYFSKSPPVNTENIEM